MTTHATQRVPPLATAALVLLAASGSTPVASQPGTTVECHSVNFRYAECRAPLKAPQLVHQLSSAPCVVNHSWGFNRKTGYLWVANGCAGVFADPSGYHYGMRGGYDDGARRYGSRGQDLGNVTAGAFIGAMLGGAMAQQSANQAARQAERASQAVDPTVQKFDRQGNPNYDADGNYIGGHGLGTLVDDPDATPSADIPEPEVPRIEIPETPKVAIPDDGSATIRQTANAGSIEYHGGSNASFSNFDSDNAAFTNSNYDGPHGEGALVDNPDAGGAEASGDDPPSD